MIFSVIVPWIIITMRADWGVIMSQIWLPGAGLHYRGVTGGGGQPLWRDVWEHRVSHSGHKQNVERSNALYHLLWNDFVSKCFFAGYIPLIPWCPFSVLSRKYWNMTIAVMWRYIAHTVSRSRTCYFKYYFSMKPTNCSSVYKYSTAE